MHMQIVDVRRSAIRRRRPVPRRELIERLYRERIRWFRVKSRAAADLDEFRARAGHLLHGPLSVPDGDPIERHHQDRSGWRPGHDPLDRVRLPKVCRVDMREALAPRPDDGPAACLGAS